MYLVAGSFGIIKPRLDIPRALNFLNSLGGTALWGQARLRNDARGILAAHASLCRAAAALVRKMKSAARRPVIKDPAGDLEQKPGPPPFGSLS